MLRIAGRTQPVDWFNHRRVFEPIGNIPPAKAEELYYAVADNIDMAA